LDSPIITSLKHVRSAIQPSTTAVTLRQKGLDIHDLNYNA